MKYKIYVGSRIYYWESDKGLPTKDPYSLRTIIKGCYKEHYGNDDNRVYVDLIIDGDFYVEVTK